MQIRQAVLLATMVSFARPALAQEPGLHQLQTEALLAFAEHEVKVLGAAFSAAQFDIELMERMIEEITRTVDAAKRSLDRTSDLLPEDIAKGAAKDVKAVRELLVRAEAEVATLKKETEAQVKPYLQKLESEDEESEGEIAVPDWDALKDHVGWIYLDVSDARKSVGKLSKLAKTPALKPPAKPKGKRG